MKIRSTEVVSMTSHHDMEIDIAPDPFPFHIMIVSACGGRHRQPEVTPLPSRLHFRSIDATPHPTHDHLFAIPTQVGVHQHPARLRPFVFHPGLHHDLCALSERPFLAHLVPTNQRHCFHFAHRFGHTLIPLSP